MTPIPWDPNGVTWPHEPKCPSCLKFDADCKCDPRERAAWQAASKREEDSDG